MKAWKRMASGQYIDLNNLTKEDISIHDINTALNNTVRFNGHYKDKKPLTVAQHSYMCYLLAKRISKYDYEYQLAALTHDFAETYIGDVSTPAKKAMGDKWYNFAKPIENLLEVWVFGEPISQEMHDMVKIVDLCALDIERRCMWSSQYGKDKWPPTPLDYGTIKEKESLFDFVSGKEIDLIHLWKELDGKLAL